MEDAFFDALPHSLTAWLIICFAYRRGCWQARLRHQSRSTATCNASELATLKKGASRQVKSQNMHQQHHLPAPSDPISRTWFLVSSLQTATSVGRPWLEARQGPFIARPPGLFLHLPLEEAKLIRLSVIAFRTSTVPYQQHPSMILICFQSA